MKIKQFIVITNPEGFLRGDYSNCFNLFGHALTVKGWIVCGEIEFDIDPDMKKVMKAATDALDDEISKHSAPLNVLENRKRDLLAVEFKP